MKCYNFFLLAKDKNKKKKKKELIRDKVKTKNSKMRVIKGEKV